MSDIRYKIEVGADGEMVGDLNGLKELETFDIKNDTETWLEKYNYAKKSCLECLENPNTLVDFHGLEYWAGEVERFRREFRESGI